jgi:hypothetical protein
MKLLVAIPGAEGEKEVVRMAVKFADVVERLRQRFPELREVPIYVGSPVCALYGPCFLSRPGAELAEGLRDFVGPLLEQAGDEETRQLEEVLEVLSSARTGVHLPEDTGWVEETAEAARQALAEMGLDPAEASLVSDQLEAIASRIRAAGLEPTEQVVAEFMVLHEVGHYVDWLKAEDKRAWEFQVRLSLADLLGGGGHLAEGYRQMEHEARADEFALAYLKKLYQPQRRSLMGAVLGLFDSLWKGGAR